MPITKTLGMALGDLRRQSGLTQREIAEKANVSYATIEFIETDRRMPRLDTFLMICKAYNADPAEMLEYVQRRVYNAKS